MIGLLREAFLRCCGWIPWVAAILVSNTLLFSSPAPVGSWDFENPQNLLQATEGAALTLHGSHTAVAGPRAGDQAVRIGVGSHYECAHGILSNGTGVLVNRYSLLVDFRVPALGPWYCFFQTEPANQNDGDCFVRAHDGAVGVGQTGYSTTAVQPGTWQRLAVAVDNERGRYRLFLDGELILDGSPQAVDGRFALAPTLLLFADENGEDAAMDVARVAIYDLCLTAADVAEMGGVTAGDPANPPPQVLPTATGPTQTLTGQTDTYGFTATDPDGEAVSLRVDWGDGDDLSPWSSPAASGVPRTFTHAYRQPGNYLIRVLARDARGRIGTWTAAHAISVSGPALVEFLTPPYLQNVRTNGLTIMWELDVPVDGEVEYGIAPDFGDRAVASHAPSGAGTEIYRCQLAGLAAGTTHQFRIRVGGREGPGGGFTTAPLGTPDFSFAVWSDSQGSNHGAYPADPLEPTKAMFRHMATNAIPFAVTCGDLAEDGGSYGDTRQFYLDRVARLLGVKVPWFVAWGNHDGERDTVIRQFADLPSQQRPGFGPGYGSYAFDYAGCHFICLDLASVGGDIESWLEQDLQSPANREARFTFLFIHVPPYCELWIDGDESLRATLAPLMEAYGVDVCFSGHTHEYSRGELNGVSYCVTGGGSWLDLPEVLVRDWEHMTVGGYHAIPGVTRPGPEHGGGLVNEYVRVDVHGDTLTASMIGFAPDGSELGVLDQFTKTRASEPPAPEVLHAEDFEGVPEFGLPEGWVATHRTTVDVNSSDPENPRSNPYLTWTVVSSERLGRVFGNNRLSVPAVVQGRSVYAESDHRSGVQLQYLTTPDFDLDGATHVEVSFRSNYLQNQDSLAALEYSVDQGRTWLPALCLLEVADVVRTADGTTVDAVATLTRVDPDGVPTASGGAATGGTYGEHVLSRPLANLGPFIEARVNDDAVGSRRVERRRVVGADGQATVRFRFTLVGTASWFWGIDDFQLCGVRSAVDPVQITGVTAVPEGLRIEWIGPAGPYQLQHRATLAEGTWLDHGLQVGAAQRSAVVPAPGVTGFFRVRLAR